MGKLSPQDQQALHTAIYQIRSGKMDQSKFDMGKVNRAWDAINTVVSGQKPQPGILESGWEGLKAGAKALGGFVPNIAPSPMEFASGGIQAGVAGGVQAGLPGDARLARTVAGTAGVDPEEVAKQAQKGGVAGIAGTLGYAAPLIAGTLIAGKLLGGHGAPEEIPRANPEVRPTVAPRVESTGSAPSEVRTAPTPIPSDTAKVAARTTTKPSNVMLSEVPGAMGSEADLMNREGPNLAPEQEARHQAAARIAEVQPSKVTLDPKSPAPAVQEPRVATEPIVKEAPSPLPKTDLESRVRQYVKDPTNLEQRGKSLVGEAAKLRDSLDDTGRKAMATQATQQAETARLQAGEIRRIVDAQPAVAEAKARLGEWGKITGANIDEETGLPIKGATTVRLENPVHPTVRASLNKLLGRNMEEVRATDEGGHVYKIPPMSDEQVSSFLGGEQARLQELHDQVKAGLPAFPSEDTLAEIQGHQAAIEAATGMRERYAGANPAGGGIGKLPPAQDVQGVWRAPGALPELTPPLLNKLMGLEGKTKYPHGVTDPRTMAALERRVGELNREADARNLIAQHLVGGDAGSKLGPIEQKSVVVPPTAPKVGQVESVHDTVEAEKASLRQVAATTVPDKPATLPGHFLATTYDETGKVTGYKQVPLPHGPGHVTAGPPPETESPLEQLVTILNHQPADPAGGIVGKVRRSFDIANAAATAKPKVLNMLDRVKAGFGAMVSSVTDLAPWTDRDAAVGRWSRALQENAKAQLDFRQAAMKAHPSPLLREGIYNYVMAGGDSAKLQEWTDHSRGALKKGYQAALDLTDTQKIYASNLHAVMNDAWGVAHRAGVLDSFIENYMPQHFLRGDFTALNARVQGVRADLLRTTPDFARERFYENSFEGEQAGLTPTSKDYAVQVNRYFNQLNQSIASRAFIRDMTAGSAKDGRPLVAPAGAGRMLEPGDKYDTSYLINPRAKPEELGDYRYLDSPAMRKHIWATNDENGNPIFVKGDVLVHPDHFQDLKNILGTSAFRNNSLGRALLRVSTEAKNFVTSFSAFHELTEDIHAASHLINPFNVPPLDIHDATTAKLLEHGAYFLDTAGRQDFGEGLAGGGLVNKIPGIGPLMQAYQEHLFQEKIPAIKQAMMKRALANNMKTYGDSYTEDQILALTAREGNAAFGGLNLKMMGRNPTVQDAFRLMALAPDFFEARARFVGQALKAGGREQAYALIRQTLGTYVPLRVINASLNNGDPKWDKPFGLVVNGRTYQARLVAGDIERFLDAPDAFMRGRENPVTTRTFMEAATGRDELGRRTTLTDQATDLFKHIAPIPAQRMLNQGQSTLWDATMQAVGVNSATYRTPGLTEAYKLYYQRSPAQEKSPSGKAIQDIKRQAAMGSRTLGTVISDYQRKGIVTDDQVDKALDDVTKPEMQRIAGGLTFQELAQVWRKATPEEKVDLKEVLLNKMDEMDSKPLAEQQADQKILRREFK